MWSLSSLKDASGVTFAVLETYRTWVQRSSFHVFQLGFIPVITPIQFCEGRAVWLLYKCVSKCGVLFGLVWFLFSFFLVSKWGKGILRVWEKMNESGLISLFFIE